MFLYSQAQSDYRETTNKPKIINLRSSGGYEVGSKCFGKPVPCLVLLNQVRVHSETESVCAWFTSDTFHLESQMRSSHWKDRLYVELWRETELAADGYGCFLYCLCLYRHMFTAVGCLCCTLQRCVISVGCNVRRIWCKSWTSDLKVVQLEI